MVSSSNLVQYLANAKPADLSDRVQRVAAALLKGNRAATSSTLLRRVEAALASQQHATLRLTTARPASAEIKKTVQEWALEQDGVSTVEIIEQVDPTIVGGVKIDMNDTVVDASVAGALSRQFNKNTR